MHALYSIRLLSAFETSFILFVLAAQGTFLLSLLGLAAGVDVTPGSSLATAG
jgi:hypothetical protein